MDQMTPDQIGQMLERFNQALAELAEALADWLERVSEAFCRLWQTIVVWLRRVQLYLWLTKIIQSRKVSSWIADHIPESALLKLPLVGLCPPRLALHAAILESMNI